MTNLNHPTLLRPASPAPVASLRGSVKGALALLALILLGLLLWQLFSQFRHTQADQRQQTLDASAHLADHLNLNLALKAQQALNVLQPYVNASAPAALPSLLATLRERLPALRDLAWLDQAGQLLGDSLAGSPDRQLLDELVGLNQGRRYFSPTRQTTALSTCCCARRRNRIGATGCCACQRTITRRSPCIWTARATRSGCWKTAAAARYWNATLRCRPAASRCKA